jgi:HEAT repeat protein
MMPNLGPGAMTALGNQGDLRAVPALIQRLSDCQQEHTYHCEFAIEALGKLRDPRAVGPLVQILNETKWNWSRRRAAAEALGEIGDTSAVPALEAACGDTENMVRGAASRALEMIRRE